MKAFALVLITAFASVSAYAKSGSYSCTANDGTIITGSLDSELNVSNAMIASGSSSAPKAVEVLSIDNSRGFKLKIVQRSKDPMKPDMYYTVKSAITEGTGFAIISTLAGNKYDTLRANCTVLMGTN